MRRLAAIGLTLAAAPAAIEIDFERESAGGEPLRIAFARR